MENKNLNVIVLIAFVAWFACMPSENQNAVMKITVTITALITTIGVFTKNSK
jgi:hypothetical protein